MSGWQREGVDWIPFPPQAKETTMTTPNPPRDPAPPLLLLLEHAAAAADAYVGQRCITGDWYRAAIERLKRESLTSPEVCARINGALMPVPDEVPDAD